jgi:hypothetical protein
MTQATGYKMQPRSGLLRRLALPALFFLGGIAATGWFITRTEYGSNLIGAAPVQPIVIDATKLAPANGGAAAAVTPSIISGQGAAMAPVPATLPLLPPQNSRANMMVLLFATRHALERGLPLGAMEAELQAAFGTTQPYLLSAVTSAAEQPVKLEDLRSGLIAIAPALRGEEDGWWPRLSNAVAGLATVRRSDEQPSNPGTLVPQAISAIDAGHVAAALGIVMRLPLRTKATEWIAKAKRYAAADRALDSLERATLVAAPAAPPVAPTAPIPAAVDVQAVPPDSGEIEQ